MTIYYTDGRSLEGVLLRRTDDSLRVAVEGSDDVEEFTRINGVWVSGDCEPVRIEFAWERHSRKEDALREADFLCSHELAARLIHLLWNPDEEEKPAQLTPRAAVAASGRATLQH